MWVVGSRAGLGLPKPPPVHYSHLLPLRYSKALEAAFVAFVRAHTPGCFCHFQVIFGPYFYEAIALRMSSIHIPSFAA